MREAQWGDEDVVGRCCSGAFFLEAEDVDVEDAFAVGAVAEEVGELRGLLVVVVIGRHEGVAAYPAVRGELAVFGAGIVSAFIVARHVAGLAGGDDVLAVEGKRTLLAEAGALPLVIDREGAEELVIVEFRRDGGLVAGGAEFGLLKERAHFGLGVAVEVGEDFSVCDGAGDGSALVIDQDGGVAHDVAAGSGCVSGLHGVAGGTGDAFVLKGARFGHALGEVAGEKRDGVVATLAVARELHALLVNERVDVLEVPRGAEGVGVHGLAPLVVGGLVAVAAVFGSGEDLGAEELAVVRHGVRGQEGGFLSKRVVVF